MPAELLKMYPAKYHRLLSHFHKENIQKCIAPYNNGDITLLTNELNRWEGIWGQKLMYSAYSRMTGNRGG